MSEIVQHGNHALVVQRYRVRFGGRTRRRLLAVAGSLVMVGILLNAVDTHPAQDGAIAGWCLFAALFLVAIGVLRRTSYSVTASVAGVRYHGGLGDRWFPWDRIDRFATHWQEVEDHQRRRVLVVLRDAVPQALNPGFSRRPMTAGEVGDLTRWLNEWVVYRRDPRSHPVPVLPAPRRAADRS